MHVVQADDEDALVTTLCGDVPSEGEAPFTSIFHSGFIGGLEKAVEKHPKATLCRSCRAKDIEKWMKEFGSLVDTVYRSMGHGISPVEESSVPRIAKMELESMLRDCDGVDGSVAN